MHRKTILLLLLGLAVASGVAQAQPARRIHTGSERGAYHTLFCPPWPPALAQLQFTGYACTPSLGTLDNIEQVLRAPGALGFGQFDVFSREAKRRPEAMRRLAVIRQDLGCEGLWLVTRNDQLTTLGDVQAMAPRLTVILPPRESGSAGSFAYLRELDAEGLGRVPEANIRHAADATAVVEQVADAGLQTAGFFVQFADPEGAVFQRLNARGLRVVPVVSRALLRARTDGETVYQVQEFTLRQGGPFGIGGEGRRATTACTPLLTFTSAPESLSEGTARADQRDMIDRLRALPVAQLLPERSGLDRLLEGTRQLSQDAVDGLVRAGEQAREAADRALR